MISLPSPPPHHAPLAITVHCTCKTHRGSRRLRRTACGCGDATLDAAALEPQKPFHDGGETRGGA